MVLLAFRKGVQSTIAYEHRANRITATKYIKSNKPCQRTNDIDDEGIQVQNRHPRSPVHLCIPRRRSIYLRMGDLFPHHNSSRQSGLRRIRNIRILGRHHTRTLPPLPSGPQNRREAIRILSHYRSSGIPTPRLARPKYRWRCSRCFYCWVITRTSVSVWHDCVLEVDSEKGSG